MMGEKPVILIITGAYLTPSHYRKLITAFEEAGYEAHCPHLPSVSMTRPPVADLATDCQTIRSYAESLITSGRQIIVLMHSYGGLVGTGALCGLGWESCRQKGLSGGVSHLVYMCAYALPEDFSLIDMAKAMGRGGKMQSNYITYEDMAIVMRYPGMVVGEYSGDQQELQEYLDTLQFWNARIASQLNPQAAWREIPSSYIFTRLDTALPYDTQQTIVAMMKERGREPQTYALDTGHSPNFTTPTAIVEIIDKIAV